MKSKFANWCNRFIVISLSFLHPSNDKIPIFLSDSGIIIFVSFEHPSNDVNIGYKSTIVNDEQFKNDAKRSIWIKSNDVQSWNSKSSINIDCFFPKRRFIILFVSETITCFSLVQFQNANLPIEQRNTVIIINFKFWTSFKCWSS